MSTVPIPSDLTHLVQVIAHPACGLRAECLCGWASSWTHDRPRALAACRGHRACVSGAGSTRAAALAALLDLQDDLVDMIQWLAGADD